MPQHSLTIAGISSEAVKKATGKTWEEWLIILDQAGAKSMIHKDIAQYLYDHNLKNGWWCQMITVGYEQARGMRKRNQRPDGYEISVSKVIAVPLSILYEAWVHDDKRLSWLNEPKITIRKTTPHKYIHLNWIDGTASISVNFYAKGEKKSQVVVQHGKLSSETEATHMKQYWKKSLNLLTHTVK